MSQSQVCICNCYSLYGLRLPTYIVCMVPIIHAATYTKEKLEDSFCCLYGWSLDSVSIE